MPSACAYDRRGTAYTQLLCRCFEQYRYFCVPYNRPYIMDCRRAQKARPAGGEEIYNVYGGADNTAYGSKNGEIRISSAGACSYKVCVVLILCTADLYGAVHIFGCAAHR